MANLSFYKVGQRKLRSQKAISSDIRALYANAAYDIQRKIDEVDLFERDGDNIHYNRLMQLQSQVEAIIDNIGTLEEQLITDNVYMVANEVVEAQKVWLKDIGFDEGALNIAYAQVPQRIVAKMVSGEIYTQGWSLSNSIWRDKRGMKRDIYTIVANGLVLQDGIYEIAKDLEKYVNPNKRVDWNLKMKDGRKIYRNSVDYNSQRLARTLVQHSYQQSIIDSTKDNPFIQSWVWRATGSRSCPICVELDGTIYTDPYKIPLDHPNGMCTVDVVEDPNLVDQLADWINDEDGTYPEIDEFAKNFGYPQVGKDKIVKPKPKPKPKPKLKTEVVKDTEVKTTRKFSYKKERFKLNKGERGDLRRKVEREYGVKLIDPPKGLNQIFRKYPKKKTSLNYNRRHFRNNYGVKDLFKQTKMSKEDQRHFVERIMRGSPEYRENFYDTLEYISYFNVDNRTGSYYHPGNNFISLSMKTEKRNAELGFDNKQTTIFHELGHAMDQFLGLRDLDPRDTGMPWDTALTKQEPLIKALDLDLAKIAADVKEDFYLFSELIRDHNTAGIQDVLDGSRHIGAKQKRAMEGQYFNWGHSQSYWTKLPNGRNKSQLQRKQEVASELFAHMTSAQVSDKEMAAIKKFFPNSLDTFYTIMKGK